MTTTPGGERELKYKRRYCRSVGCTNTVKSQGLCCRHGASIRMCKVPGCDKQAQGNFDGMCKSHFKKFKEGEESTLMALSAPAMFEQRHAEFLSRQPLPTCEESIWVRILPESVGWKPQRGMPMPLMAHFELGCTTKKAGWHRNEERNARGLLSVDDTVHTPFETWELVLCNTEILLLTGTSEESFLHLSKAWGRPHGFHEALTASLFGERVHTETCWDNASVNLICGDLSHIEELEADLFDFDDSEKNNFVGHKEGLQHTVSRKVDHSES